MYLLVIAMIMAAWVIQEKTQNKPKLVSML